jgi:hypothetical protein
MRDRRPLSVIEQKNVIDLLNRGWYRDEIHYKISARRRRSKLMLCDQSVIDAFIDEYLRLNPIDPLRMSVTEAYLEFPNDPPGMLAKRLGRTEDDVIRILEEKELPFRR